MAEKHPAMKLRFDNARDTKSDVTSELKVVTLAGQEFMHYAKNRGWEHEIFEDLLAPAFQCDMIAETWIRNPPLPSYCRPNYRYEVHNINRIYYPDDGSDWKETQDHSKWGLAVPACNNPVVCIGDINRMSSQLHRGGGYLCMKHPELYAEFHRLVKGLNDCDE
eukprot:TRINITY_DN11205_c0_g1_i1.p1 TRINITY_DN11205_c0_g1~~TRINITY_DN11205_c0_g1_i1.p1  ORF type:complete len:164 (+),score=28.41 TRINITY_DN11205_c0_g1_i1:321-812(+)